jgi:hypothetical protein
MGAWGPGIFSNDTAADVRSEYRELLEDHVPDEEATQRVIASNGVLAPEEEHELWLALAAAQHEVGRLDDEVRRKALDVIDGEQGLDLWAAAGSDALRKRRQALAKLRDQLTGPQPAPKKLRRPWRHETDLVPGVVLSYTASNGKIALLRVLRIDVDRVGAAPILERLDWDGTRIPSSRKQRRLNPRTRATEYLPPRLERYRVARFRKKDPDYRDCGFDVVATLEPRPEDQDVQPTVYNYWGSLRTALEQDLAPE